MGDGGAEGSSAIGDGGQAAVSFTPDVEGTGSGSLLVRIFKSSQLGRLICRGLTLSKLKEPPRLFLVLQPSKSTVRWKSLTKDPWISVSPVLHNRF